MAHASIRVSESMVSICRCHEGRWLGLSHALVLFVMIVLARQAQAGPTEPDLSIQVPAAGCSTNTGATSCDVLVGTQFTVELTLDDIDGVPNGYRAWQARLVSSLGLTFQDRPGTAEQGSPTFWPDCFIPGEVLDGLPASYRALCISVAGTLSTYTGLLMEVDYECPAFPRAETVTLVHTAPFGTGLLDAVLAPFQPEDGPDILTINCVTAICGDGVWQTGEECDDGNIVDGDGCSAACLIEDSCGDGLLDPGEECDDGNTENGDGCSPECLVDVCGVVPNAADFVRGDVNNDGEFNIGDSTVMRRALALMGPGLTQQCVPKLPATGQMACYRVVSPFSADAIPCVGTGQDGEFQTGVPLSYLDNGDGTITDLNTGLTWAKKSDDGTIHDKDNSYTWEGAFSNYVATLNTTLFAGHSDWRVPNVRELQSILDYSRSVPSVDPVFHTGCTEGCTVTNCSCTCTCGTLDPPYSYWSSTTFAGDFLFRFVTAFIVVVDFGQVASDAKSQSHHARAVRGGL